MLAIADNLVVDELIGAFPSEQATRVMHFPLRSLDRN